MKRTIKLTESQLKKVVDKLIVEQGNWPAGNYTGSQSKGTTVPPTSVPTASTTRTSQPGSKFNPSNGYKAPETKVNDITSKDGKWTIKLSDTANTKAIQTALARIGKTKTLTIAGGVSQLPEIGSALATFVQGSGIDGVYGQGTKNAIITLQRALKLPVTGYVNNGLAKILSDTTQSSIKSMFVKNAPQPEVPNSSLSTKPNEFNSSINPEYSIQESIKKVLRNYKKRK